jgi:hypothetical protein
MTAANPPVDGTYLTGSHKRTGSAEAAFEA